MTVLILSEDYDPSVDRVVMTLDRLGVPVFRADLGWFPRTLSFSAEFDLGRWVGVLRTPYREARLEDLRSVWYRRPTAFSFPDGMSVARRSHAEQEARLALGGVLPTLPVAWVNHPQRDADHAYKPRQLALATACGLETPRTLVTSDSDAARKFYAESEYGVVTKVLGSNIIFEDGQRKVFYTHRINDQEMKNTGGVDLGIHLFQDWVPKAYDLRLIAVGTNLFAVGIHTDDAEAHVDWRINYDTLDYKSVEVPTHVALAVQAFMTASGIKFSALDFVITPDDRWVFLESNSGGQYGWLKGTLGTAVSDAIASLLAQGG